MRKILLTYTFVILAIMSAHSQSDSIVQVMRVHSNMYFDQTNGNLFFQFDTIRAEEVAIPSSYTLEMAKGKVTGTRTGLEFDFGSETFSGKLTYGFIPYGDSKHPHPVYFRASANITGGIASVNIAQVLRGRYDMIGWERLGYGTLGYRVIGENGNMIYDGKVSFTGRGPFEVAPTLIEGPFVNLLQPDGATISYTTSDSISTSIEIGGKTISDEGPVLNHELVVVGLQAETEYEYTVNYGTLSQSYKLKTAPEPGARSEFTFAYASDSRAGNGGGERDIYGANFYIMKKIMALAKYKDISFMQFSGDLINGYHSNEGDMDLQYANWKRAVEPFAHYFPIYISMGNHESFMRVFRGGNKTYLVDRFPYETESGEYLFAKNFVNPRNGPDSEDGAAYDPDLTRVDFPSYKENVFYYTYDNVGVVVLNSDYWYAPSTESIPEIGGGLHGYIMDNQLKWLRRTIRDLEKNKSIDHVFVTQHTPIFPNGGHVRDDMWYGGDNTYRPYVNGKALKRGIIERRDEILDIIVNQSTKVIAVLTGDEHNYCRTTVGPETLIYDNKWSGKKLELERTIYQVNNGAAGAPYYAQEVTPWTPFTNSFTTQNALVFFHVKGASIQMEVLNPDTLEKVDELKLR